MTRPDDPYRNPVLYDLEYADYDEDVGYYENLAHRIGGPILEMGCGSGRLTLPLARAGHAVDGFDVSEPMLGALRDKLLAETGQVRRRVRVWNGDFRNVEVDRHYPLVLLPFNALHHCMSPEEVLQVFAGATAALLPGGRFGLDCYLPDRELYLRNPNTRYEERIFTHPTTGVRLHSWERGWFDEEAHIHHVIYAYEDPQGRIEETHLRLRMYERDELADLIEQAGYRIRYQAKDFQGTEATGHMLKWVLVLGRAP